MKISGIKYMESFARQNPEIISLSQGSLKVGGIPKEIKSYTQDILNTDKTDYYANSYGVPEFREKLATTLSQKHNTNISSNQILVTHGSSGAIAALLLSILGTGDEVLLPEPTYPAYSKLAQVAKAKTVFVPCLQSTNSQNINWSIDIEKIKAATTQRTKIIIITNPSNPTGTIIPSKTLHELANWCNEKGIYLISDEVYDDYIFDGEYQSITPLVNESSHIIRCGSFSKNFSMSGWRVGYAVMPEEMIENVSAVQDSLIVCPSVVGQYAALYALDHPELTQKFAEEVQNNLTIANKILQPLVTKSIVSYQKPQAAFYLFLKTTKKDTSDLCLDIMQKSKVTTVPGSTFGPSGDPFIRICFARERHVLEEGLNRFVNYFTNYWNH